MEAGKRVSDPDFEPAWKGMPSTRYQGSKRKLLGFLQRAFEQLEFDSCLDAFGGTGSVSHLLRKMGKRVHYNDIMPFNCVIAEALFAEGPVVLKKDDIEGLFVRRAEVKYRDVIEINYPGVYFLDRENHQLDTFCANIKLIQNQVAQAEAYYLLFQAMLSKRPFNLFHRANLDMRTKNVRRSFGNKVTWDRPFVSHMQKFHAELSSYRTSGTTGAVEISCQSAFEINHSSDLVYIDTPYAKGNGPQESNYFDFYHFLDAILDYDSIPKKADRRLKHKPVYPFNKPWHRYSSALEAFSELFKKFSNASLVVSYRNDGYPTNEQLVSILKNTHKQVWKLDSESYNYALSKNAKGTKEITLIAVRK